jgi:Zn-dependent protease with chaperone function
MPYSVAIAPRRSVALFALLAIVMVIASYIFVIVLAAACVYLPYWILTNAEHLPAQILLLLLGGIVIAGAMLWSLVPRRDKFEPPGPLLHRTSHPRLFAELDQIASSLEEPVPAEVYLIGDVNAFVADRGGILGLGSHRIMAIGLPLLSILTVSEFRGVLAHEFAHYYSGDTKLGPFVYKTQSAMIRTFQNIGSIEELRRFGIISVLYSVVTAVLKNYFILFLRVTNFVSRKKEYRADELACAVAGAAPFIQGLRKIHGAGMAWPPFWNTEVVPMLNQNCLPSISDGFAQFLSAPEIAVQVAQGIGKEMEEGKADPYDTHPPLRDRIAAIERLTVAPTEQAYELALSLLGAPETAELQFLAFMNPRLEKELLRRVGWDELGPAVTIPSWKSAVAEYASLLEGITAGSVPDFIPKLPEIGSRMRDPKGLLLAPQQRTQRAVHLFASALALTLLDKGWQLQTKPGQFYFYRGAEKTNVFALLQALVTGELSREAWASSCTELGITDSLLVPVEMPSPAGLS